MSITILYTRVSSVDQKTDRQRVKENEFDKVIEDKCSGAIPIFERPEGSTLKTLTDRQLIKSISVWQIDRCGRDLRDIINFIHYTTERGIPVNFLSQGLCTLNENKEAIKKIGSFGKYAALTAIGTYVLLSPQKAQASSPEAPGSGF